MSETVYLCSRCAYPSDTPLGPTGLCPWCIKEIRNWPRAEAEEREDPY